jgi:hypothetical protein
MILKEPINFSKLFDVCRFMYYDEMVKAVVDIERELIAIDGDMHADLEKMLLENGSQQRDLWGINLYPENERIEFDSLINIRPRQNNKSRGIEDPEIAKKVAEVAKQWILHDLN